MLPRIEEGDLLLVDPDAKPSPGSLALVRIGGRITVRQVLAGKRGHLLVAANPKVAPAEEGDLLGVVSEVRRRL
jgi:SOS-response transcriptional repressor LexA